MTLPERNLLESVLPRSVADYLARVTDQLASAPPHYFGIPTKKNPLDLWVYQEILFELRPTVVIEIGNWRCGSTRPPEDPLADRARRRLV